MSKDPHIVIVGAGFGGLACAKALGNAPARVTVIDRANYHLFVPLLYQVATAALSPADIARPIRRILGRYKNIDVVLGDVTAIDTNAAHVDDQRGANWSVRQARRRDRLALLILRSSRVDGACQGPAQPRRCALHPHQLLTAFERADSTTDQAERDRLMTIIVVGGGPTGVEMAGSVAELARHALARDFRHIDPRQARILLVEAGPRLLSSFPQSLAEYARTRAREARRHRDARSAGREHRCGRRDGRRQDDQRRHGDLGRRHRGRARREDARRAARPRRPRLGGAGPVGAGPAGRLCAGR